MNRWCRGCRGSAGAILTDAPCNGVTGQGIGAASVFPPLAHTTPSGLA
jgi:hypothetical protein